MLGQKKTRNLWCILLICQVWTTTYARLSEPGKTWSIGFEPAYRNDVLRVQLKVYDWWASLDDTAVVAKGTTVPIIGDICVADTTKCPKWTVPGDINITLRSPPRKSHYVVLYLIDTGNQVAIYGSPTETVAQGCTGKQDAICCNNQEYSITRASTSHKVYQIWTAKPNVTNPWDGTVAQNYRGMGLTATVRTGYSSTNVSWDNIFFNKRSANPENSLSGTTDFSYEIDGATLLDPVSTLASGYLLLLPTTDAAAAGFVIPKIAYPSNASPIDLTSWKACRTSQCGAAVGSCAPKQGPTPYGDYVSTTSGDVLASIFNTMGRPVKKMCQTSGPVPNYPFVAPNLTVDALHLTQRVSCDYIGSVMYPTLLMSRSNIEAAQNAPPSPPPRPPSSPPLAGGVTASPPSPTLPKYQGPVVVFVATLPSFTNETFNNTMKEAYVKAVQRASTGASKPPQVNFIDINPFQPTRALRKLMASTPTGIVVDTSAVFNSSSDSVAAQALLTSLQQNPSKVFPPALFGKVTVTSATELNCVVPCGDHGTPQPWKATDGNIGCVCQCDSGWQTAPNQSFDSFKPCNQAIAPGSSPGGGTGENAEAYLLVSWRPPVPVPPPPAPIGQNEGGSGMTAGKWVGIVIGILAFGGVVYLVWKFWSNIVGFFGCCVQCCAPRSAKTADDSAVEDEDAQIARLQQRKKEREAKMQTKGVPVNGAVPLSRRLPGHTNGLAKPNEKKVFILLHMSPTARNAVIKFWHWNLLIKMRSFCVIVLLALCQVAFVSAGCKDSKALYPEGGKPLGSFRVKGYNLYWCEGGELDPHSEGYGKLYGGVTGKFGYDNMKNEGYPYWSIKDTASGKSRLIFARKTPIVRTKQPGSVMTNTRRAVLSDTGNPKGTYIIRSDCKNGPTPPKDMSCQNEQDFKMTWDCKFEVVQCPN